MVKIITQNNVEERYEFPKELDKYIEPQLMNHLKHSKDWEKMETTIPGVYIVKFPAIAEYPARLLLEIKPSFEIGMLLESLDQFSNAEKTISDPRTYYLMRQLEETNSKYALKEFERENREEKKSKQKGGFNK